MSDIDKKLEKMNINRFDIAMLGSHVVRMKGRDHEGRHYCPPKQAANMLLDGEIDHHVVKKSLADGLSLHQDTNLENNSEEKTTPDSE